MYFVIFVKYISCCCILNVLVFFALYKDLQTLERLDVICSYKKTI